MAANDNFPRGWTASSAATGAMISITIPGSPGIAHVLDGFDAKIIDAAAGFGPYEILVNSSDGAFVNFPIGVVGSSAAGADESSASGLNLEAGPGASLNVEIQNFIATTFELLVIQGHDN